MIGRYLTNIVNRPLTVVRGDDGMWHLLAILPPAGSDLIEYEQADVIVSAVQLDGIGDKLNELIDGAAEEEISSTSHRPQGIVAGDCERLIGGFRWYRLILPIKHNQWRFMDSTAFLRKVAGRCHKEAITGEDHLDVLGIFVIRESSEPKYLRGT